MILHDLPDADYHSRSELSSTGARMLLDSPARFHHAQSHPQPHKDAFDLGTAVHTKVLGKGPKVITYPPEHLTPSGNASVKAATVEWAAEQRANGLVVIGAAQAAQVDGMSEAVLAHPEARAVLESIAGREVSIITEIDGVPVRARFDLYDGLNAADLKTTRDASPKAFNRSVGTYGYHIQKRWYDDAHTTETGDLLRSFKFLAVETTPPHLVGVYELDFMWDDIAAGATHKARSLYRECTESGMWPGYAAQTLTAPTWAVYDADDEEIRI